MNHEFSSAFFAWNLGPLFLYGGETAAFISLSKNKEQSGSQRIPKLSQGFYLLYALNFTYLRQIIDERWQEKQLNAQ